MPYTECILPPYPVESDLWDELSRESRPIVIYGMGNGADKLIDRLAERGIAFADIFASDGFVRGHSFRGVRVKSFSEIKAAYPDFVILLSFASNREEVLSMLSDIDREYDMYIPDMPVADATEYFDKDFYNAHYSEILEAYNALSDSTSKNAFASIIRYKLSGKMSYLESCYSTKDELYSLLPKDSIRSIIDVGAYNGDTLGEAKHYFPHLTDAVAIEPDPKTYKRLLKFVDKTGDIAITPIRAAAWCESTEGVLLSSSNRNSSVSSTASHEHKSTEVELIKIDDLMLSPDYIKYDVEGAELEALEGSHMTITQHAPALLVSLYHRSRDIFSLVCYLHRAYPGYRMTLRRLRSVPAWEIDLILTT